jgi:class 3 adenylate cyclase
MDGKKWLVSPDESVMAGQITTRPDFSGQTAPLATPVPRGPAVLCLEVTEGTVFMRPGGGGVLTVERACELAAEAVRTHNGSVLNVVPEMVIAEFEKSAMAVRAALEIQRRLSGENENSPRYMSLELKMGVYASASLDGAKAHDGATMNASTKFARRAGPGQILISRGVYQAVSDDSDLQCQWVASLKPEGDGQPEDVFEVSYSEAPACVPSRYEVLSRVGTGGMGIVYKVRDLDAREVIALKILKPEAASNEAMQENLRREVFLARKVTHKNVCRIHEFNRSKGTAYISMEFIEGESLLRRLRRVCALPLDESLKIVRQICAGLREAHLQGIVHRDLKPANIMLDAAGNVKIMDFGIARLAQENVQHTGTIAGTPSYMAPEQVNLQPVGPRTDIYSIGLLMYEMIVGKQAFEGENSIVIALKQLNDAPKRPREIVPTLPSRVEDVIMKCLEKDPAKRFQTIDEFEAAVERSVASPKVVSLADAMETDLRRAGQNMQALVHRSVEKARPAVPVVVEFTQSVSRAAQRMELKARYKMRDGLAMCSGYYRRWLGFSTKAQALTASAAVGFLLVGVVAFARSGKNTYASDAAPVAVSAPGSSNAAVGGREDLAPAGAPVVNADADSVKTEQVDLSAKLGVSPEPDAPADSSPSVATTEALSGATSAVAEPAAAEPSAAPPAGMRTRAVHASTKFAKSSTAGVHPMLASVNTTLPMADAEQAKALSNAAKLDPVPAPAGATADAAKSSPPHDAPASANGNSSLAEPYLDVVSFKDQLLADQAVTQISKLGMHAFSVQKSHLWMETFHVEVGPFASSVDMSAAEQRLSTQGYKPHASK